MEFAVCPKCFFVEFVEKEIWENWKEEVRFVASCNVGSEGIKFPLPEELEIDEHLGMECQNCGALLRNTLPEEIIVEVKNGELDLEDTKFNKKDKEIIKKLIVLHVLKEIRDYLKEEGIEPIEKDEENRVFYLKLHCNWYTEGDGEYLDWDIEAEELVILGKKYDPEAFDLIVENGYSPSHFYDLTSKEMEITEENLLEYLEYEIENFLIERFN